MNTMRSFFVIAFATFTVLTVHVTSTDHSSRSLRRQPGGRHAEVIHSDSYREELSDEIDLEIWDRWLQQDQSMKTSAPLAPIPPSTRQPIKAPVPSPLTPPTKNPVISKAPNIPPLPTMPMSLSPVTRAPIAVPKSAPVLAPSTPPNISPSQSPQISPVSKAPSSRAPTTKVPSSKAPTTTVPSPKSPSTTAPSSKAPISKAPSSKAPISKAPSSKAPSTIAPSQAPISPPTAPDGTLLEFIQSVAELSTLLTALTTADTNRNMPPFFLELLNNTNTSITLFPPVNAGFTNLAQVVPGYLTQLLTPNFGLHLFEILAYHATPGIILSNSFPRSNLLMLAGGTVNVTASSDGFAVQSFTSLRAQISTPFDVRATNGLAQVVDNVLLPQFVFFNLVEGLQFANSQGQFSTLLRLIAAAGLEATLTEVTGVTLIAPINSGITSTTETFLLQPGNEEILSDVLRYHVLAELFNFAAQKTSTVQLYDTLLDGARVVVGVVPLGDGNVFTRYNQAVQSGYSLARESILYTVDRLLIPPLLRPVIPGVIATNSTPVTATAVSDEVTQSSKIKWISSP